MLQLSLLQEPHQSASFSLEAGTPTQNPFGALSFHACSPAKDTGVGIYCNINSDAPQHLRRDTVEGSACLLLCNSETIPAQEDQHVCRHIVMDHRSYTRPVWEDVSCLATTATLTTIAWPRRGNEGCQCSCSFLVTGANAGLGYEASKELARKNGHVVMAVRDPQRGDE